MKKLALAVAMAAGLAFAGASGAAPTTTFGGATANADGSVTLDSSKSPSAGIDLSLPSNTFVGDLTAFSTDYNFASGCPNGVPRLTIITVRGPIWVSLASVPGFTCASGAHSVYVLNPSTPVDTSQILGGTANDTWGHAHSEYDNLQVNNVQLVTTGANQTVTVANVLLVINQGAPTNSL